MERPPVIRAAENTDMEGVLGLLNGVFSAQQRSTSRRDEGYWRWKFRENPFGASIVTVAELDRSIVGVDNLWPWELSLEDTVIRAAQPCDSAVHEGQRGQGIFRSMRMYGLERAREGGMGLIFNYPNANSLPLNLSLGWHYLGKINWWVKILRPLGLLAGGGLKEQAEPAVMEGEYTLDTALIDQVDQGSAYGGHLLRINRKPGFHAWRYAQHPYRSYGMVHYRRGGESTIAIFTINQKGSRREMVIVDLVGSAENTVPAVKMALEAGRQMGAVYCALMNNPGFATRELWKLGFIPRRFKNMAVLPLDADLWGKVNKYSNWSLMAGMHDSI